MTSQRGPCARGGQIPQHSTKTKTLVAALRMRMAQETQDANFVMSCCAYACLHSGTF